MAGVSCAWSMTCSPLSEADGAARARDKVADRLGERTAYKRRGFVDLRNHLAGDPIHTTGDHDGQAVLLDGP
ncbi:MAG: hypothetical protein HW381_1335 [Candidatus Rokubacteria bacterium]|nr:hypothetical protein [Candidatus Rokubacteria bacterium]